MTESVEWERLADHEATVPEPADSWYDDAPITDEQIEAVRRDLDTPVAQRGAAFAPFVVRKLLAEIDRLNTVLDANRVVRNAAESSSRTLKGVVELLKTQRTQLRAELDKCAALNLTTPPSESAPGAPRAHGGTLKTASGRRPTVAEPSAAVQQAREELAAALVRAGTLCIELLDGSTPEKLAETDKALEEARFKGIVLNELLLEEAE